MDKIIKGKLVLPPYLTPDARDLVKKVGTLLPRLYPAGHSVYVPKCHWPVQCAQASALPDHLISVDKPTSSL